MDTREKIEKYLYRNKNNTYTVQILKKNFTTSKLFADLEEAKHYRDAIIREYEKATIERDIAGIKDLIYEYPHNLLRLIDVIPELWDNYYEYIVPHFEENFEKIHNSGTINDRTYDVLIRRFKNYETLEEIGKAYNLTRERIRQIEQRGLLRLKHYARKLDFRYQEIYERSCKEVEATIIGELTYEEAKKIVEKYEKEHKQEVFLKNTDIAYLDFSARTLNCLKRTGIRTIEELLPLSEKQILKIRGMGIKCLNEIKDFLKTHGLELRGE